jgi:hypothetical protein
MSNPVTSARLPTEGRTTGEDAGMKYVLLLWDDERAWDALSEDEQTSRLGEYVTLDAEMKEKGVLAGGEGLQPPATAATVRVRDGRPITTDGPYAETKEMLGGFYVVDCATREEALEWAARIPDARSGCVEVRPVIDYEAMGMLEPE